MTDSEKLQAILSAVQIDPGGRGLARDPSDNLFTATADDFASACRSIAEHAAPRLAVVTGFYIPNANPPAMETDGPLGAIFLARALQPIGIDVLLIAECGCHRAFDAAQKMLQLNDLQYSSPSTVLQSRQRLQDFSHGIALERVGPTRDGRYHTMRGIDITDRLEPAHELFQRENKLDSTMRTIGIGDGGNEIGMGKISPHTISKNIPKGGEIHCCIPTDFLIVAGVSNWGAYALAAGVYVLRGMKPDLNLFNTQVERNILEVMVHAGPLVDGVTGQALATVDGLTWEEYMNPFIKIQQILDA